MRAVPSGGITFRSLVLHLEGRWILTVGALAQAVHGQGEVGRRELQECDGALDHGKAG